MQDLDLVYKPSVQDTINTKFSVFSKGYWNRNGKAVLSSRPQGTQDILWTYEYITSERAKWATETLRSMTTTATKGEIDDFKKLNFEAATVCGIFAYRNAKSLIVRSPYIVIDIDDLSSTEEARYVQQLLINDPRVETDLCFVSPKGLGVKWVATIPGWAKCPTFKATFQEFQQYLGFEYGICIDRSGSDVCRACFLPYDNECYINNKFLR